VHGCAKFGVTQDADAPGSQNPLEGAEIPLTTNALKRESCQNMHLDFDSYEDWQSLSGVTLAEEPEVNVEQDDLLSRDKLVAECSLRAFIVPEANLYRLSLAH
jgi:hypothetical protein